MLSDEADRDEALYGIANVLNSGIFPLGTHRRAELEKAQELLKRLDFCEVHYAAMPDVPPRHAESYAQYLRTTLFHGVAEALSRLPYKVEQRNTAIAQLDARADEIHTLRVGVLKPKEA